ncbi:hypothetical protein M0804_001302 [Polistes exclamans]|nr:hypothetical protein M0804_001302 [Polistes exclamans]
MNVADLISNTSNSSNSNIISNVGVYLESYSTIGSTSFSETLQRSAGCQRTPRREEEEEEEEEEQQEQETFSCITEKEEVVFNGKVTKTIPINLFDGDDCFSFNTNTTIATFATISSLRNS